MLTKIWTGFWLVLLAASLVAFAVAVAHEKDIHPLRDVVRLFKGQSWVGRILLGVFAFGMWVYASVKPGDGGGNGGDGGDGGTNNIQMVIGPGSGLQPMNLPGTVTNNLQQGLQGGIQPPQGGLLGDPAPVTDQWSDFTPITSTNTTRTLTGDDFRRGFVLTRIGTDEAFSFAAPADANECADWRAFGAAEDWIYVAFTNWALKVGTNDAERLRVFSFGKVRPCVTNGTVGVASDLWFAPLMASLGIVPEANWHLIEGNREWGAGNGSQFWHFVTPSNTLQLTWQNVLFERLTNTPVSVQMEVCPNGRFAYRYDLSRLAAGGHEPRMGADVCNQPLQRMAAVLPFRVACRGRRVEPIRSRSRMGNGHGVFRLGGVVSVRRQLPHPARSRRLPEHADAASAGHGQVDRPFAHAPQPRGVPAGVPHRGWQRDHGAERGEVRPFHGRLGLPDQPRHRPLAPSVQRDAGKRRGRHVRV